MNKEKCKGYFNEKCKNVNCPQDINNILLEFKSEICVTCKFNNGCCDCLFNGTSLCRERENIYE